MTDRTPHEGERHTLEERLDTLLANNHAELLYSMAEALDTNAGLQALATLRRAGPAKAEGRVSEATPPPANRPPFVWDPESGVVTLRIGEDPSPVIERIEQFIDVLDELRHELTRDGKATSGVDACAYVLTELVEGLEERSLTRGEAMEILDKAKRYLESPASNSYRGFVIEEVEGSPLLDDLDALSRMVVRMFDDAHDNISIEN
ncbi:hypothetical protein ACIBAG_31925 [Streptomyces sp. NPDC051243]|uniref:hypothetical protein n=1 Tax=Streptomyces sp. NPDC051243 TaxID=3365646 RepID=UPI0037A46558